MAVMKTPGVYIVEKNAFPNSVVEVATAVPAFIGYTGKALNGSKSLKDTPWRITSMAEYHSYFGGPSTPMFGMIAKKEPEKDEPGGNNDFTTYEPKYTLYYHMLFFLLMVEDPAISFPLGIIMKN